MYISIHESTNGSSRGKRCMRGLCMYVYVYAYTYVDMYKYTHANICIYTRMHIWRLTWPAVLDGSVYMCIYIHIQSVNAHNCMYANTGIHNFWRLYIYPYIYIKLRIDA